MKKSALLKSLAGICLAFILFPQTVHAAGFVQDTMGVKYQNDDGSFLADAWVQVGQNIYHLDANGIVQTGWIQVGNLWYLLDANGVCTNPAGTTTPPADTAVPTTPTPPAAQNETGIMFANAGWVPFQTLEPNLLNSGIAAGLIGSDGVQYWLEPTFAAQVNALLSATPQATEITFVLNNNTKKFHYPTCREVNKIKDTNRQDSGLSFDEISAMGYQPCKICKPTR